VCVIVCMGVSNTVSKRSDEERELLTIARMHSGEFGNHIKGKRRKYK